MPAELAMFRPETGEEAGHLRSPAPAGECALSWAAALRAAPDYGFSRTNVRIASGREQVHLAAAGAAATGLRGRAGPARRRADAVTREGGVAATPLQGKRDAPAE